MRRRGSWPTHANRRTDYSMVTDHPADLANSADYGTFLDRMESVFEQLARVSDPIDTPAVIVRADAYQKWAPNIFTGAIWPSARRAPASPPRAT